MKDDGWSKEQGCRLDLTDIESIRLAPLTAAIDNRDTEITKLHAERDEARAEAQRVSTALGLIRADLREKLHEALSETERLRAVLQSMIDDGCSYYHGHGECLDTDPADPAKWCWSCRAYHALYGENP